MPTEEAKRIIKQAINDPEFVEGISASLDLVPCIKAIFDHEYVINLESLRHILDKRINELQIRDWFIRINRIIK